MANPSDRTGERTQNDQVFLSVARRLALGEVIEANANRARDADTRGTIGFGTCRKKNVFGGAFGQ